MPAKAVATPTAMRTIKGKNLMAPLKLLPMSGVIFAEMQPIDVTAESPFAINSVAVKVVKA